MDARTEVFRAHGAQLGMPRGIAKFAQVGVLALVWGTGLLVGTLRAGERFSMDTGWRFHAGDPAGTSPVFGGTPIREYHYRPADKGEGDAAVMAAPDLKPNDAGWKAATAGDDVFHGRLGFCWLRTSLPKTAGAHPRIYFDGVDDNATVYLNGRKLMHHEGWSDPFEVDLRGAWRKSGPNVLAVLVENTDGPGGINAAVLVSDQTTPDPKSPVSPEFDDSQWRTVNTPHDFVVEGRFDPKAQRSHGYLPVDVGWYRRAFRLPGSDKGRRIRVEFDGVYRSAMVWFNGVLLGTHASGYTSFYYDVTRLVRFGAENVLAVRVDARRFEGWWYEGGGIYRHVWLTKLDPVHVAHWGVFVHASVDDPGNGSEADAQVGIETTVVNEGTGTAHVLLRSTVRDTDGNAIGESESPLDLPAGARKVVAQTLKLSKARLWSPDTPYLHKLVTAVVVDGRTADRVVTPFGVRTFRFDPERGFFLNGRPLKIKGTCNHQDFAGVGVALPDRLQAYKIEKLKEMGSNGYRCSHHPPAPEILDACDRLGMLVMDENRHLRDSEQALGEVESMVSRDRNHPSIILWSLCNEEWTLQGTERGRVIGEKMKEIIRRLDPTRPITAAMNGGFGKGLSDVVDVQGFNYKNGALDPFHKSRPRQSTIQTESGSVVTTRGIYLNDAVRGYVSCLTSGPDHTWQPVADRPYLSGTFVWTGFDYRGEPSPYDWPCISSHFGLMDTCGFPKDDYYYYKAWWTPEPVLHIFPHWNWAYGGRGKQSVTVFAYGNCERVELFLNGKSQGAKDMPRNGHLDWTVKWAPGVLLAKGFRKGKEVVTAKRETTGAAAALRLKADRGRIRADGEDVAVVTVAVVDPAGRTVPTANNGVMFDVQGPALLIGVGNGDPSCHEPDKGARRRAFNGLCLAILQSTLEPGTVHLTARSDGLSPATLVLQTTPCKPRLTIPPLVVHP